MQLKLLTNRNLYCFDHEMIRFGSVQIRNINYYIGLCWYVMVSTLLCQLLIQMYNLHPSIWCLSDPSRLGGSIKKKKSYHVTFKSWLKYLVATQSLKTKRCWSDMAPLSLRWIQKTQHQRLIYYYILFSKSVRKVWEKEPSKMNKKRRNNQTHVPVKLSTNENVPWMIALSCTKYLNTFRIQGIHARKMQVFRNIENKLS